MRGLAEFIMRGRWQALAVAVLGAGSLLFGWLSAAAVALVTLRKGVTDGSWLVLWALLPALLATACVTINIYFPAAAAEKAADRIIEEVWGAQPEESAPPPDPVLVPASVLLSVQAWPPATVPEPDPEAQCE